MSLPARETQHKKLRQEIRAKAQRGSELSRKIRHTQSAVEAEQLSEDLLQVTKEMEPLVATLAAYQRQKQVINPPAKKTEIECLKQEIRAKAQKGSELSRKIRHTQSAVEVNRLSEEMKQLVDEMEPLVTALAAYRRQKRVESAQIFNG